MDEMKQMSNKTAELLDFVKDFDGAYVVAFKVSEDADPDSDKVRMDMESCGFSLNEDKEFTNADIHHVILSTLFVITKLCIENAGAENTQMTIMRAVAECTSEDVSQYDEDETIH